VISINGLAIIEKAEHWFVTADAKIGVAEIDNEHAWMRGRAAQSGPGNHE